MSPVAALLPLLFPAVPVPHPAPRPLPVAARVRRVAKRLAPGITLIQDTTPEGAPGGPLVATLLRVDPKAPGVRVEAALGQDRVWNTDPTFGREIVSRLARRRGALAAVNAGFFPYAGNPIGLHVEHGDLVTEPSRERTAFALLPDGVPAIGAFRYDGRVRIGDDERVLHGLNRKPGKGTEMLLFTPRFAAATLPSEGRWEVVLEGVGGPLRPFTLTGTVRAAGVGGATPIAENTVVLSAGGASAAWLREKAPVGARVTLALQISPIGTSSIDPTKILHAVTGAPRIVSDGKPDIRLDAEKVATSFSTTRHPRTAAGIARDGTILLLVVDGRQRSLSRGATLPELAALMIGYGAVDAVNLDGGGSSTLVVDGQVLNAPSEGPERPVADALLVYGDVPDDAPSETPTLTPPERPLAVGETFAFALPDGVDRDQAVWGTNAGPGFVDQNGRFRALRPGKATVTVRIGKRTAKATVDVVAAPPTPTPAR